MTSFFPDIYYWLAAIHLEGIGPLRIRQWLNHFKTIKALFLASYSELQEAGLTQLQIKTLTSVNWKAVEKDYNWCEKRGCWLISCDKDNFPTLLNEVVGAPLLLFGLGDPDVITKSQLAMVGSRNPTVTGLQSAEQFGFNLAQAGLVITSGLAAGIDAASHRGALNAGGKTVAVCGTGLKHIYPPANRKLADDIIANGALISEFLPDTRPRPQHFPMRNRIISGMSLGVFVIEAALKSGSLTTARFAAEQGREIFALPGSIHNPLAKGCHQLIRQGAKLVETATDILEELGALKAVVEEAHVQKLKPLESECKALLEKIGYEITALDAIIARSGLTAAKVSSMLLTLELEGYIHSAAGGYVRIK
jgi:DNA processing protein